MTSPRFISQYGVSAPRLRWQAILTLPEPTFTSLCPLPRKPGPGPLPVRTRMSHRPPLGAPSVVSPANVTSFSAGCTPVPVVESMMAPNPFTPAPDTTTGSSP